MNLNKRTRSIRAIVISLTVASGVITARAQIIPNNSYAQMLNTTMVASQNLFNAQMSVNQQRARMAAAAGQSSSHPGSAATQQQLHIKQYPITATDFQSLSAPITPDEFANAAKGVSSEVRERMRTLFLEVLASFGTKARKDNMANAFAFISAAALQVRNGKEPTSAQVDQMIAYFNNSLAASPQYYTLNPRQQQMLYESLILTGGIMVFIDVQGRKSADMNAQAQAKQMSDAVLKSFLGI